VHEILPSHVIPCPFNYIKRLTYDVSVIVEKRTASHGDTGSHNRLDLTQVLYQHTMYVMDIYPTVSSISGLALTSNQQTT
jgi:hypothetical protein